MAKSMAESLKIPHFGYSDEIDMTELVTLRQRLKGSAILGSIPFSYMPVIIKVRSLTIKLGLVLYFVIIYYCIIVIIIIIHIIMIIISIVIGHFIVALVHRYTNREEISTAAICNDLYFNFGIHSPVG